MNATKARHGGTNSWVVATGLAVLVALAVGPVLAGTASAAPITTATATPANQWAYGGQGWDNGSLQSGNATLSWASMFGFAVIFTSTTTGNNTVMLEEQRTVGMHVSISYSGPLVTATYTYHGAEADTAFANLTNDSTVYVAGNPVPALGIENASVAAQANVEQSLVTHSTVTGHSHSAWLNISGSAAASVAFAPALGLIPLNLSGVPEWNSSATATPSASWTINYAWADLGWNGTSGAGAGKLTGNLSASGPVSVTGYQVTVLPLFHDHVSRTAVLLVISGPLDAYDGFILIPHGFDLFGGAPHGFDADALGSAGISAETLYVSHGPNGLAPTAASTTFGASGTAVGAVAAPSNGPAPSAGAAPGATVLGSPMSVAQAQAESNCLQNGCGSAAPASLGSLLGLAVVGLAVVAVVGTVAVIEWRSYARRRSQKSLVGGYGESWSNGVPPAGATGLPAPPAGAPSGPEENLRRP
jgi:hypothetical protein